jgi:hypothetical protein
MRIGFHGVRLPKSLRRTSDERGAGYFTLSYTKFPYSPDVFPDDFVIICSWADDSRGEGR